MRSWTRVYAWSDRSAGGWAGRIAAAILLVFVAAAVFAPLLSPYSYEEQKLEEGLSGPSAEHLLGQDKLGRDVLSRLIWGARVSLIVGFAAVLVSIILGTGVGLVAGYAGGLTDLIAMRIVDIFLAFPGILLAIALTAVLGPSLENVVLALAAFGWVSFARLVRGQVLTLREQEYILAARSIGVPVPRILLRHILPGVAGPLVVQASFALAGAILAEASLSFLGLGVQDLPSWGGMLNEASEFVGLAPHLSWAPGIALVAIVLSFNVLGDSIKDRMGRRG